MSSKILYEDKWGEIIDRPRLELIEIRWHDSTAEMTGDEFCDWLSNFAGCVETKRRPGCLVDAVQFRMPLERIDTDWRDDKIIPRYNAAGVKKFAFIMPEGVPLIGADQAPEGPATYPTAYFGERSAAIAWVTTKDTAISDYDENADVYRRWTVTDNIYWRVEQPQFFKVLGSVRNLDILELACGDGRISRMLMERGARSVLATDISKEMIKRAIAQNKNDQGNLRYPTLTFEVLDACDETFKLNHLADRVVAMYLFHYAPSEKALEQMCQLIGRNLTPGGRLIIYTINPDYDFAKQDSRLEEYFGFSYSAVDPPHYKLVFGKHTVNMWHWSKDAHEDGLRSAGLTNIQWHPLCLSDDDRNLTRSLEWYLDSPSCIVLSAEKSNVDLSSGSR